MHMHNMGIHPLPGWVLIKPLEEVQKAGLLEMPDAAKEELMRGEVVEIGGDGLAGSGTLMEVPPKLVVGSTVVYKKYGDHVIEIDGEKYRLCHLENLMAVISKA